MPETQEPGATGEPLRLATGPKFTAVGVADRDERFYFCAAAATFGFSLAEMTPGLTNVYSVDRKYDPDEPGDVRAFLPLESADGISLAGLSQVWVDWESDLNEAATLPARLSHCLSNQDFMEVAELVKELAISCAIANMRLFSLRRFGINDPQNVTQSEQEAIERLDALPGMIAQKTADPARHGARMAAIIKEIWNPGAPSPHGPAMAG